MMKFVQITNTSRTLPQPLRVRYCDAFFCRLRGLMFQNQLGDDQGLLLVQKRENRRDAAIHMFFVGMDLGVVWMNRDREVVDLQLAKSWRPLYTPEKPAKYVLEIHPNRLEDFILGDILDFEENYSY